MNNRGLTRLHYFDNIKLFGVMHVVLYHVITAYILVNPYINESELVHSHILNYFLIFTKRYIMSLFFFMSGYVFIRSLGEKSKGQVAKKTSLRYGVPIVLSQLVMHFFYEDRVPVTWYLEVLLLFVILTLLIENKLKLKNIELSFNLKNILVIGIMMGVLSHLIRLIFPPYYVLAIPFFHIEPADSMKFVFHWVMGIIAYKNNWLDKISTTTFRQFTIAAICFVLIGILNHLNILIWFPNIFDSMECICLNMAIICFSQIFFNKSNFFLSHLQRLSMGVYIMHCIFIVMVLYLVKNVELYVPLKIVVVFILSLSVSFAVTFLLRKITFFRQIL